MTCSGRLFCEEDRTSHFFHWRNFWLAPDRSGKICQINSLGLMELSFLSVSFCVCVVARTRGFPSWRTQRCLVLPLCPLSALLPIDCVCINSMEVRNMFSFSLLQMRFFCCRKRRSYEMIFLLLFGMLLMLAQLAGLFCIVLICFFKSQTCIFK